MKIDITYKRESQEFNQQYADEYNFGKESDGNWRYDMIETYSVDNMAGYDIIKDSNFILAGHADGKEFSYMIPNVITPACLLEDGSRVEFCVSKSLVLKTQKTPNKKYGITRIYFYLKPVYNFIQWDDTNIFDIIDFPKELLRKQIDV